MIQIEESRFLQLSKFEEELNKLFENIVIQYCKEWVELNPEIYFTWQDKKDVVAEYVNNRIVENGIIFNGRVPEVWFNMVDSGVMLYWSTNDSRSISEVNKIVEREKNTANKKDVSDIKITPEDIIKALNKIRDTLEMRVDEKLEEFKNKYLTIAK